jgi:hypothetical protein
MVIISVREVEVPLPRILAHNGRDFFRTGHKIRRIDAAERIARSFFEQGDMYVLIVKARTDNNPKMHVFYYVYLALKSGEPLYH